MTKGFTSKGFMVSFEQANYKWEKYLLRQQQLGWIEEVCEEAGIAWCSDGYPFIEIYNYEGTQRLGYIEYTNNLRDFSMKLNKLLQEV